MFLCFDDGEIFGLGHVGRGNKEEEEEKVKELMIGHDDLKIIWRNNNVYDK